MILTIPESFVEQLEISCLSLDEVLSNSYEPLPENERNPLLATERFDRWVEIAAGGDSAQFARRLEVTSLSFEDVLARFGGVRRPLMRARLIGLAMSTQPSSYYERRAATVVVGPISRSDLFWALFLSGTAQNSGPTLALPTLTRQFDAKLKTIWQ